MGNYLNKRAALLPALPALLLGLLACVPAQAALLSAADQARLASWLGEGPLALTAIFTKTAGDTSVDFHHAADGKGRTFSLMQASNELGQTWLVGGYNPQSWSSAGGYHMTDAQSARTGFIFNLTTGEKHMQTPRVSNIESFGAYQTINDSRYGPSFGIGADLYVPQDLTTGGYSLLYSYSKPDLSDFYTSMVDGARYTKPNLTIGALEVYTIAAVPEASAALMLAGGLALLALMLAAGQADTLPGRGRKRAGSAPLFGCFDSLYNGAAFSVSP